MASSEHPVVGEIALTPVTHPVIHKIGNRHIVAFLLGREAYERVMMDHQKAGSTIEPVWLKASICPKLLSSLIRLKEFGDATIETLKDDVIKKCSRNRLRWKTSILPLRM